MPGLSLRALVRHPTVCLLGCLALAGCNGGGGGGGGSSLIASNDTYSVAPGQSITVSAPGVLANDTGTSLTAEVVSQPASAASFTFNANGSFSYTHNGSAASDSFTYRAINGSSTATATVTIALSGSPPVATNACHSVIDNQSSVTGTLTATNPDGGSLTYSIVSPPSNGTVSTTPAGVFTYFPNAPSNRRGMDKFTFRATGSGNLQSQLGTVTILNGGNVRVMPLGDSITAGDVNNGAIPDSEREGYRRRLYQQLEGLSSCYGIDFVGYRSEGLNNDFDKGHEGHGGGCASGVGGCGTFDVLQGNVAGWLQANPADVVLLHIGINDLTRGHSIPDIVTAVDSVLDDIQDWAGLNYPVTVFVARIIRDVPGFLSDLPVNSLNNAVESMVSNRSDRTIMVDMENGAGLNYGSGAPGADMSDNVHPGPSGYNKMAAKWLADMTNASNVGPKFIGLPNCP